MDVDAQTPAGPGAIRCHQLRLERMPALSRQLLQALLELTTRWLDDPLREAVDGFAAHIAHLAESAGGDLERQSHMGSRVTLLPDPDALREHVIAQLAARIERLGCPDRIESSAPATTAAERTRALSAETRITLESMTTRGLASGGPALIELGYRMAMLAARPPLEGAAMPLGPHALADALHTAIEATQLDHRQKLKLLRRGERAINHDLATLYETLNGYLRERGLLPQLRLPDSGNAASAAFATDIAPGTRPAHEARPDATSKPHSAASGARGDTTAGTEGCSFQMLRGLLASSRRRSAQGSSAPPVASQDEVLGAIASLQRRQATTPAARMAAPGNVQHLREQLIRQINARRGQESSAVTLSDEHDDVLVLVGMLFEQMGRQTRMGGSAHGVLGALQLAIVHTAVSERHIPDLPGHPAGRLLAKVVSIADDWLDAPGSDPDQALQDKLDRLVGRVLRESPDSELYAELLGEIEHDLGLLERRAQTAERRHVEAMEGRDRLDRARQRACQLMAERCAAVTTRGLLRALLDRAWTDVLALTLLRHGEPSDALATQVHVTDQLLGRATVTDPKQLLTDVETGLRQIGMSDAEAMQLAQRLIAPDQSPAADSEAPSATEMLLRLRSQQRFGGAATPAATDAVAPEQTPHAGPDADSHAHMVAGSDVEALRAMTTGLRSLPFGTWLEFADSGSGLWIPRKLAWFSADSGQALLVNRRGQRCRELTMHEIAEAMLAGHARTMEAVQGSVLERAWRRLASMLRHQAEAAGAATMESR